MLYSEVLAGVSLPAGVDTLILLGGTGYVMLGNSSFLSCSCSDEWDGEGRESNSSETVTCGTLFLEIYYFMDVELHK